MDYSQATINMEHLIKSLQAIGLSDKEAKVYLTLLQLGPSNPYRIAKKSGLKRPTAYVIAEELVKKNFIIQSPGKKIVYIARSPEVLFDEKERKIYDFKNCLPELQALRGGTGDKPTILYFEGISGLKQALMHKVDGLDNMEIVGFYADPDFTTEETREAAYVFNAYRMEHNIKVRALVTESDSLKPFMKYFEDKTFIPKYMPKNLYSSNASFEFYPNLIKIIFYDTAISIIIESPTVAKAMRQIFDMLWLKLGDEYQESKISQKAT